jgi:hypothetical protein
LARFAASAAARACSTGVRSSNVARAPRQLPSSAKMGVELTDIVRPTPVRSPRIWPVCGAASRRTFTHGCSASDSGIAPDAHGRSDTRFPRSPSAGTPAARAKASLASAMTPWRSSTTTPSARVFSVAFTRSGTTRASAKLIVRNTVRR